MRGFFIFFMARVDIMTFKEDKFLSVWHFI